MTRYLCGLLLFAQIASGTAQRTPDGTGEISGTVTSTSSPPASLSRVLVTVSGKSLTPSRTAIADERGRFAFRNLPAGSFTLVAARPPYVKSAFGAKRPGRPGTPVELAVGQRVTDLTIRLARGSVITGLIRDPNGDPAAGVTVAATPFTSSASANAAVSVVTDDRGVYRIFGLTPGPYVVKSAASDSASGARGPALGRMTDAEMDELLARLRRRVPGTPLTAAASASGASQFTLPVVTASTTGPTTPTFGDTPIFYPGTPSPDDAVILSLGEDEERAGIDINLQLVRTAAIDGRVSISSGPLPQSISITLARQGRQVSQGEAINTAITRAADQSGVFRFGGLMPGQYRLTARAIAMNQTSTPGSMAITGIYWALADITIREDDVTGVTMALQPGVRLSGRIVFDARAQTTPSDPTKVSLRLVDLSGASTLAGGSGRSDGTFEITNIVPGTYGMTSTFADATWWLRSVVVNGRDVLDFPLELGGGGDITGAVVTFTDRHTELSGTLQTAANVPAPDYFVVALPAERAFWRPGARRVQSTRPSTDGRFVFRDLPAGDYLIAALTDMEPSDLLDTTFLEALTRTAWPAHLNEGEKKTQDLRIGR